MNYFHYVALATCAVLYAMVSTTWWQRYPRIFQVLVVVGAVSVFFAITTELLTNVQSGGNLP